MCVLRLHIQTPFNMMCTEVLHGVCLYKAALNANDQNSLKVQLQTNTSIGI